MSDAKEVTTTLRVVLASLACHGALAVLPPPDTTAQTPCVRYQPDSIAITGTLERLTFPGRPNYTDVKTGDEPETGFYLRMAPPICTVARGNNAAQQDIRLVQLVLDTAAYNRLRSQLGTVVTVKGTLFAASTGHHHASLLLQVLVSKDPVERRSQENAFRESDIRTVMSNVFVNITCVSEGIRAVRPRTLRCAAARITMMSALGVSAASWMPGCATAARPMFDVAAHDSIASARCRSAPNHRECAEQIERTLLAQAPVVTRDGNTLRIVLKGGGSSVFHDSTPDAYEGFIVHTYSGYLKTIGYHVLRLAYYEGGAYLLVNASNGARFRSNGAPVLSPDAHRIAAANVDLEAGFTETTLQIWHVASKGLTKEFEYNFLKEPVTALGLPPGTTVGPAGLHWVAPDEVAFQLQEFDGKIRGERRARVRGGVWAITK